MMRLAAVVVLIVLPTSAWAQCAGWQGTAEARMECCAQEEQCPMHKGTDGSMSHRSVTQEQADTCCALSERVPSTPSSSSQIAPVTFAVVSTPPSVLLPDLALLVNQWESFIPIAVSPVPRHLLLSVFLV
jgi:hypothetical protein